MVSLKHTGFHFDEVQVISFFFVTCAIGIILKTSFTSPESQRFTPVFSSKNFCTFGSYSEVTMHLEFIFVYGLRWESKLILLHVDN